jgi:hypothetical protein
VQELSFMSEIDEIQNHSHTTKLVQSLGHLQALRKTVCKNYRLCPKSTKFRTMATVTQQISAITRSLAQALRKTVWNCVRNRRNLEPWPRSQNKLHAKSCEHSPALRKTLFFRRDTRCRTQRSSMLSVWLAVDVENCKQEIEIGFPEMHTQKYIHIFAQQELREPWKWHRNEYKHYLSIEDSDKKRFHVIFINFGLKFSQFQTFLCLQKKIFPKFSLVKHTQN